MGLRPGHCYSSLKDRPYSRIAITVPGKNFVGSVPGIKTRQFNMGNPEKNFQYILDLVSEDSARVRDNAIEAARIAIGRYLKRVVGDENYFMRIRIFPHDVLRENKQAQGAHADRIQKGMSHPFGRPIGRAARVSQGDVLISILTNPEHLDICKSALMRAKAKMPISVRVKVGTDIESIGTRPRAIKIREAEAAAEAAAAAVAPAAEAKAAAEAAPAAEGGKAEAGKEAAKGKADEKKPEAKAEAKKEEKKK